MLGFPQGKNMMSTVHVYFHVILLFSLHLHVYWLYCIHMIGTFSVQLCYGEFGLKFYIKS